MIEFGTDELKQRKPIACIKVLGVGGAGGNTVNSIINSGSTDIEFIVVNTDAQTLELSKAKQKIQIGLKSTKGLGTGADPLIGKRAAEEDLDKILSAVEDADIVFLAAGMGGGTGSGALPVIAQALKEKGILSIAIITKPFLFEGKRRARVAQETIDALRQAVDTLIVIPNQKLLEIVDANVSMIDGFAIINDILTQSIRGISDIITKTGHINVDFADVKTIMKDRGMAVMGTGKATGPDRALDAALQAITSPLLENMNVTGAHAVLLNICGGKNLGLHEISQASSIIYEQAHEDANIIIGSVIDESLTDEVIVTIIATGFASAPKTITPAVAAEPIAAHAPITAPVATPEKQPVHATPSILLNAQTVTVHQEKIVKAAAHVPAQELSESEADFAQAENVQAKEQAVAPDIAQEAAQVAFIDQNDLDIPAYLRKEHAKQ